MNVRTVLALAVALLAGCGGAGEPAAGPAELVEELRAGGYVLFVRHGLTDRAAQDVAGAPIEDCAKQRNLTEAGRAQAAEIGRAVRLLGIPVGEVVSSEYCRCLDTARIAFGRAAGEPSITGLAGVDEPDARERGLAALRELLAEPPAGGTNRAVVGHVKSVHAVAGVEPDEGETVVFAPLGGGEFRVAGRIPAEAWPQLAAALGV